MEPELGYMLWGKPHLVFREYSERTPRVWASDCEDQSPHPTPSGCTLWVGHGLAFRYWQAEGFLVGGVSCSGRETGPQGRGWKKAAGTRRTITEYAYEDKSRTNPADRNIYSRNATGPSLDGLQRHRESKFLSWRLGDHLYQQPQHLLGTG